MTATDEAKRPPDRLRLKEKTPHVSLRIDRVVEDRRNHRNRVQYPAEPGKWRIPEDVVLHRWQRKTFANGDSPCGFRLQPGTWRTVIACESRIDWQRASPAEVERTLADVKREHPTLDSPSAQDLFVLVRYLLERRVLSAVLERHRSLADKSRGIPDLFIYRKSAAGRIFGGRFVEVKRPQEPVLPSQHEEIIFLRECGLKAGVMRLIERWTAPRRASGVDRGCSKQAPCAEA